MLRARTDAQKLKVLSILGYTGRVLDSEVEIAGSVSYDTLAEIVDYLRGNIKERRRKARDLGIHSNIDKLWVTDDAIWLRWCDVTQAKFFIDGLGDIGYDVDELTKEYELYGRITI